jgi:hypothetical protein
MTKFMRKKLNVDIASQFINADIRAYELIFYMCNLGIVLKFIRRSVEFTLGITQSPKCLEHCVQLCMGTGATALSTLCDGMQFHKDWFDHHKCMNSDGKSGSYSRIILWSAFLTKNFCPKRDFLWFLSLPLPVYLFMYYIELYLDLYIILNGDPHSLLLPT